MHETLKKYKELKEKHPTIDHDLVMSFADEMPEEFENVLMVYEYGCHIVSEQKYKEYVSYFENFDGTDGPHWAVEVIEQKCSIDFDKKEYTLLDFCYVVNMRYSDDGDLMSTDNILKSAKRYLEDKDYPGDPSERAYHDAIKRKKYFKNKEDEE